MKYDENELVSFAEHLRVLRARKGIKMTELAKRSGISHAIVSRLEAGLHRPKLAVLIRLARGLDITIGELIPDNLIEGKVSQEESETSRA